MNKISAVCPWAQEGPRQLDWEDPVIVAALNRYDFAASWAQGKHCLDIGCAVGYGTGRLAEVAANVVGIDYSTDALSEAKKNFREQQDLTYHNGMTGGKAPPEKWIIRPSQLRQARVLVAVCRK